MDCPGHSAQGTNGSDGAATGSYPDCCRTSSCHGNCFLVWLMPAICTDFSIPRTESLQAAEPMVFYTARPNEFFRPPILDSHL